MRPDRNEITDEHCLAEICQETLRHWPEAKAALLFGSRARGTHQDSSDWDVAFVLEGDEPSSARPADTHRFPQAKGLDDLARVNAWAVGRKYLLDRAADLGSLPYCIIRDGRLLAGAWEVPDPAVIQKDAAIKPEDWLERMRQVLSKSRIATMEISDIATSEFWEECSPFCRDLMESTSDAAELLVKAIMERRGVPADHTHDILQLIESYTQARPDDAELAKRMAVLNDKSRRDYMATYMNEPPRHEDCRNAVSRLLGTFDLWASEVELNRIDAMADMVPKLARLALETADVWKQALQTPVIAKSHEESPHQVAASTVLDRRAEIETAITSFVNRMQKIA